MPNVGAEFTASIVIDKNDLIAQALKQLSTAQKELEKNKLEIYFDLSNTDLSKKLKEYQKQLSSTDYTIKINNNGIEETYKSLDKLLDIVKTIASGKDFGTGFGNINTDDVIKQIDKLENRISELNKKYDELQKKSVSDSISDKEVSLIDNDEFKKLSQEVSELKNQFDDLKIHMQLLDDYTVPTDRFFELQSQVETTTVKVSDLVDEFTKLSNAQKALSSTPQEPNISSGDFKEQSTEIDLYHNLEKRKVTYDEIIDRIQTIVSLKEKEKSLSKTSDDTKLYQNLYDENDINWAGDTEGTINRISDRLKEIYIKYNGKISLINENDIQEAAYLLDILKGAGESPNLNKSQEKFYQNKKFSNDSLFDNIHVDSQKTGEIDKINTELSETYRWFNQLEGVSLNENIANEIKSLISDMQIGGKTANEYANDLLKIFNIEVGSNSAIEQQNKLQSELKETESQAEKTAMAVKEISSTTSQDQKKDAFHSDIDTSSSVKSLENLEEEIKKIFTDANELQDILDSLHNGKYFHLSWTTDGIDETGADERVRQLSKLLKEYGYTINNFKSDSDAFDTSGVINAIKEENNILEQNTQKVKENTQAKEQNANINLNKYDKRLDSYNGKVDKYQATIARFNDGGWTSDTYLKNVQAVHDAVKQYATLLDNIKTNQNGIASDEDIQNLDKYEKKIKDTIATVTNMSASEKGYNFVSAQKELDKIHKLLNENSKMSSEAKAKIKSYYAEIESGNPSMSLDRIHGEIMKIYNAEVEAGRAGRSFFDTLKNSGFHQLAAQMAGMFGVYDVINELKQVASTVRELDTAYTEMRKVSNESAQSLKNFQKESFSTADSVGTTALALQDATATWMRLGESLDEAKESAKDATVLLNVSEFENIDEATDSLVAMSQAYKELDKMEIIDVLDKIGNEYSISTNELSTALKDSAAVLKTQGNDLAESVALITAGNAITQDVSKTAGETLPERYRNIFYRTYLTARAA